MLNGESPVECYECDDFEKCHKITTLVTLRAMQADVDLITQNGLVKGWLKDFFELDGMMGDGDEIN